MTKTLTFLVLPVTLMGLAACEPVPGDGSTPAGPAVILPESVTSIAAPFQDLSAAHINPADGCYWYTHKGPVETTELPLRTTAGNPICTREQEG